MNTEAIIRAWKDPTFRASLTTEQRAAVPDNPSGKPVTELDESELDDVTGGIQITVLTAPIACCTLTRRPQCFISYRICPTRVCTPQVPTIIEQTEF